MRVPPPRHSDASRQLWRVLITEIDHLFAGGLVVLSAMLALGKLPAEANAGVRWSFYRQAWFTGAGMTALALWAWHDAGRPIDEFGLGSWVGEQPIVILAVAVAWTLGLALALHCISTGAAHAKLITIYSEFRVLMPKAQKELYGSWAVAVSAGAGEEIAYRGFLLWYLSDFFGVAAGLAATSLVFGLAHGYQRRLGIVSAAVAGLVLGCVYLSTGSLFLTMWMHASYNVASFTVGYLVLRTGSTHHDTPERLWS